MTRPERTNERVDVVEFGLRRVFVTTAVILGALMEIVDTTIVNVALPDIQGNVGASQDEGTFIVTGYIVANVVVIPLSPWLQRRFGRKQYFFASIALFTFASAMCGLSHDLVGLVFWRIMQGAGGGGLLSQAQAILRETFPPKQQGLAQSIFAVGAIVGPTMGPLLGGAITDNVSWQWCFFVNLPLGITAGILTLAFLRNPERPERLPVDGVGLGLLAFGLGALQYVLDQGQEKDWFGDATILQFTIFSIVSLAGFILWELRFSKNPIVDLRIFRYTTVSAGCVLGMTLGITLLGTLVTLPQYVQGPLGFTATLSGALIATRAAPVLLLTPLSARLAATGKLDARVQIGIGFVLIGLSNVLVAKQQTPTADFGSFVWPLLVGGIGLSQVFVPLSLAIFASVPPSEIAKVSAMFNLARQMGGSLATALLITLLDRSSAAHQTRIAADINERKAPVVAYMQTRGGVGSARATAQLTQVVEEQANVLGYADTSRASALITFGLAPFVLLLRRSKSDGAPSATTSDVH